MSTSFRGERWRGSVADVLRLSLLLAAIAPWRSLPLLAQGGAEATAAPAILVTPTPEGAGALAPTITPSATPSPLPAARLQALQSAGKVNVRALPDIESELLGTIAHGALYPVTRNYYRWYELKFESSPTGLAWVYGDLVTIEGDESQIDAIESLDQARAQGGSAGAPDPDSNPRTIEIATVAADSAGGVEVVAASPLPTYTPPATQRPLAQQLEVATAEESRLLDLPPLAPILALAGLGMIGFVIGLLRR